MCCKVRNFRKEDSEELKQLKTLFELELQWSPPRIYLEEFVKIVEGISREDPELVKVLVDNSKIVGYCIASKKLHSYEGVVLDVTMDSAYVWDMFVLKKFRGKGYGEALLRSMLQYLKQIGKRNVFLIVNVWNNYGKKFYENNGFRTWGYFLRKEL